jgi:hypothetical protein
VEPGAVPRAGGRSDRGQGARGGGGGGLVRAKEAMRLRVAESDRGLRRFCVGRGDEDGAEGRVLFTGPTEVGPYSEDGAPRRRRGVSGAGLGAAEALVHLCWQAWPMLTNLTNLCGEISIQQTWAPMLALFQDTVD